MYNNPDYTLHIAAMCIERFHCISCNSFKINVHVMGTLSDLSKMLGSVSCQVHLQARGLLLSPLHHQTKFNSTGRSTSSVDAGLSYDGWHVDWTRSTPCYHWTSY